MRLTDRERERERERELPDMRLRLWLTRPPPALILLFFLLCLASALIPLFLLLRHPSTETPRETPAETVVKEAIEQHKIVIFSKSYCPYCKRAKAIFSELNEKPFVIELDQREDGYDIQKAVINLVARRTVPQVFIHKQHLGGADDTLEAYQSGKLAKLLEMPMKVATSI